MPRPGTGHATTRNGSCHGGIQSCHDWGRVMPRPEMGHATTGTGAWHDRERFLPRHGMVWTSREDGIQPNSIRDREEAILPLNPRLVQCRPGLRSMILGWLWGHGLIQGGPKSGQGALRGGRGSFGRGWRAACRCGRLRKGRAGQGRGAEPMRVGRRRPGADRVRSMGPAGQGGGQRPSGRGRFWPRYPAFAGRFSAYFDFPFVTGLLHCAHGHAGKRY